jgi:NTE family protein
MTARALVLGGGGITGVAWELGILKGLWDGGVDFGGVDFGGVDLVVGTSAGAVVGSQVTTAADLEELAAAQRSSDPAAEAELGAEFDLEQMAAMFVGLMQDVTSARELRVRIGAMALATARMPEAERLAVLSSRLPRHEWPERRLLITAVDIATGDLVAWDGDSGVPLMLAVAASCAVPGVWPPVTINGRRYMDGGVRSATNLDLAAGHDVVVLAPIVGSLAGALDEEISRLGPEAKVVAIAPDDAALEAIGPNPLDPRRRAESLVAGLTQAATFLDAVREVWTPR